MNSIYKEAEIKIVNFLFALFWAYNYIFVVIEEKLKPYGFSQFFVIRNQLVEPNLDTWNCITMVNMNLAKPKLIEQYKCGSENDFGAMSLSETLGETLFIRKCDNYRLSVIKVPGLIKEKFSEFPNLNNTRFLNIMYFNKAMKNPVKLNLDIAYVRNGNEVLSKTFVYRMLSYQYNPGDYVFDDTYEVHLMDNNIRKHVLNSSQYIYFNDRLKTGYEVRSVNVNANLIDANLIDANADVNAHVNAHVFPNTFVNADDTNSFVSADSN
jgi:hypothetical protein